MCACVSVVFDFWKIYFIEQVEHEDFLGDFPTRLIDCLAFFFFSLFFSRVPKFFFGWCVSSYFSRDKVNYFSQTLLVVCFFVFFRKVLKSSRKKNSYIIFWINKCPLIFEIQRQVWTPTSTAISRDTTSIHLDLLTRKTMSEKIS